MDRFKDKVVIVTGAASGIGEATTRRIVSEGGMVVMADFAKEKTALLAQEFKSRKSRSIPGLCLCRKPRKLPDADRDGTGKIPQDRRSGQ